MLRHRNVLVIANTATAAASSVVLLLGAARAMGEKELSDFSLVQLIVMTAVMLQRSALLSPALSTQRSSGRAVIPTAWIWRVSVPIGVSVALLISATFGADGQRYGAWLLVGLTAGIVALVQDTLRYGLLSRGLASHAVVSDACWLALILATLLMQDFLNDAWKLSIYWGVSGLLAVTIAAVSIYRRGRTDLPSASIRATWRLGKWSGLDALLSAIATLSPMLLTAFVLGSSDAGIYRVLQSSLGPINILCTSLITMFGLDAWQLVSRKQLKLLRKKVTLGVVAMTGFSLVYVAFAEVVIIFLSGITSPDLMRIAVIVGLVGLIGSATSPLSAAALALGYQRHGALLRFVIVVFSLAVSFLGSTGVWLPWNDPIGTVILFAAVASLLGWAFSYRRAIRIESGRFSRSATRAVAVQGQPSRLKASQK